MTEISKYIDILEERNKAYKRVFELCLESISDLEKRIEELEKIVNDQSSEGKNRR